LWNGWSTLLSLPKTSGAGFVTGTTMANLTGLAAARSAILQRSGWNVEEDGVFGAPEIKVVVGDEVHISLLKALSLLGLGRSRVTRVATDDQGRMRADQLPTVDDKTILCLQAGNVNTGAFDPAREIAPRARRAGAWVHVDGAFGLWGAVSPKHATLLEGFNQADSWAIDCHKWLNVPYDSGMAVVREPEHLQRAMSISAAYLASDGGREPWHYTPEASRRARGIEMWAAMRSLGRSGLRDLIERNCCQAAFSPITCMRRDCRCSMMSCSIKCSYRSVRPSRRAAPSKKSRKTAPAGAEARSGTATPRCEFQSQVGPPQTMT
jgi:glutamate/tyrosine decarboxylase-like PLP-dependent enzyme